MLDKIVALLGIDQELSSEEKFVSLSFNEELNITIEIDDSYYMTLKFDIGDYIEDKEINDYIYMSLAQICSEGYFQCPSWVVIDKALTSFIVISKLKCLEIPEPISMEYIDSFLSLCEQLKINYHEIARKIIHR